MTLTESTEATSAIGDALAGIGAFEIGVFVGSALAAALIGYLMGRAKVRSVEFEHQGSRNKLVRAEKQIGELGRRIAKMRGERDTVANLALALPEVFRKLNRPELDDKEVRRLIYTLANSLFQPDQFLLYWLDKDRKRLKLVVAHGLEPVPPELEIVQVGKGKIGWVARHELEMLPEDWKKLSQAERVQVPDNHPLLRPDLIGPLVHPGTTGAQVLGVLCLGAPSIRPRDEKLMFQMVTNFGSMATVVARQRTMLRKQADHDGLTGLYNKRHFLGKLAPEMLVACDKKARPFSIFIFDIDHFKTYNDTNGHPAGDKLLRRMGAIISEHVGPQDVACRYGGEEFVIAMAGATREAAMDRAEKLRESITREPFDHREKQPMGMVSISGGIAASPRDAQDVESLIKLADQALYVGKKSGRNRIMSHRGVQIGEAVEDDVLVPDPAALASGDTRTGP